MKSEFEERNTVIDKILSRLLEDFSHWKTVKLMPGIGPQFPLVHPEFSARLDRFRTQVRRTLETIPIDELRSRYLLAIGSENNPLTNPHGLHHKLYRELKDLRMTCPPWFGSGWSEKEHLLDVEFWQHASALSLEEAAMLVVGVDPRKANYDDLFSGYDKDVRIDQILYFIEGTYDQIARRFDEYDSGTAKVQLADLCVWVCETGLKVSSQLDEIIKRRNFNVTKEGQTITPSAITTPLHGNSKAMFQRVLAVIAITKYDLKSSKDANRVAKKIVVAGDFSGVNLDAQNLAMHIRRGLDQLDNETVSNLSIK